MNYLFLIKMGFVWTYKNEQKDDLHSGAFDGIEMDSFCYLVASQVNCVQSSLSPDKFSKNLMVIS